MQLVRENRSDPANVLTYSDTTATPSTTYLYRVQAVNTGGVSGYSNTATAATPATPQLHVADLDGGTATSKNTWTASVTITVQDANSAPMSGATVTRYVERRLLGKRSVQYRRRNVQGDDR